MATYYDTLCTIFGAENIKESAYSMEGGIKLWVVNVDIRSKVTLLITDGLRHFEMPTPEKFQRYQHSEIYICLPNYWEVENFDKPNFSWVYTWINKIANFPQAQGKWLADGHSFEAKAQDAWSMSQHMKQPYLMLTDPILLRDYLADIDVEGNKISFLGVIPIFEDELDFKAAKGTYKLKKKFESNNVTELLDDFRMSIKKSKWRIYDSFFKK